MPVNMRGKALLTLMDLSAGETRCLLNLAHGLKKRMGLAGEVLRDKKASLENTAKAVLVSAL